MTVRLVLGARWRKIAWSEWRQYDPKYNWSFVTGDILTKFWYNIRQL